MARLLLAVGFGMTGAGLLLVLTPLSVTDSPTALFALAGVSVVALGAGVLTGLERSVTSPRGGSLPTTDNRAGVSTPGEGFDLKLSELSVGDGAGQAVVHERLEAVALATLSEYRDCSRDAARAQLADGEWTDDPRASAFFTDEPPSAAERFRTVLTGEPTAARRARCVVDELSRYAEAESG